MAEDRAQIEAHFNQVYDETFNALRKYAAVRCDDVQDIADILQDTYLAYYKLLCRHGAEYVKEPSALLYKIASRKIGHYRSLSSRLSRIVPLFRENDEGEEYNVADEELIADDDDFMLDHLEAQRIWEIISGYPADVRKILYLYYTCDMSHSQIAKTMGISLSGVKNKLYRTLADLRKKENSHE